MWRKIQEFWSALTILTWAAIVLLIVVVYFLDLRAS